MGNLLRSVCGVGAGKWMCNPFAGECMSSESFGGATAVSALKERAEQVEWYGAVRAGEIGFAALVSWSRGVGFYDMTWNV